MTRRVSVNLNVFAALHDAAMAAVSFAASLYLRLGSDGIYLAAPYWELGVVLFTAICVAVFISMRLYRGIWRYASIEDLTAIAKAVSLSILIFSFVMFFASRLEGIPRSVLVINWLVLLALLGGPRFAYRALKDRTVKLPSRTLPKRAVPILLIGVNDQAELFLRDIQREADAPYEVVAIVDDNKERAGRSVHGVRIYHGTDKLALILRKLARKGKFPQRIVLSGEPDAARLRDYLQQADALGLTLGRLPRLSEFKSGELEGLELKPVAIEELLGRKQAVRDREEMRRFIEGRRILVTGAGGSIGGELCRQIAQYGPASMIFFEQSEYALYQIGLEVAENCPACPVRSILGDVRQVAQVEDAFRLARPELVFHAAAIKHVPLAEENPLEALSTNALGTRNIAEACRRHGVETMVLISTDKAVHPANVMGASKRLAELVCQSVAAQPADGETKRTATQFVTVRFGNVLGSTGSVVPLFRRQLEKGGPITVTHPDMVRYFMTIREAVELVIRAAALAETMPGERGPIFVLDMGEPVKIDELARQMIRLSGLKPDRDIVITYTGLRPGEKLYEELFYASEALAQTAQEGILLAAHSRAAPDLQKSLDLLTKHCRERSAPAALALLRQLVPEYENPQKGAGAAMSRQA